jgi:prepilin-type N-terminal cleavage/methylation domain-containing protein
MIMMNKNGFTLIELLVVISIISLLSSVVFASLSDAREKGRIAAGQKFSSSMDHAIRDELVGEWTFDNDTLVDTGGLGNNGVYEGGIGALDYIDGVMGRALNFNGLTARERANFGAFTIGSKGTYSLWIRGVKKAGDQRSENIYPLGIQGNHSLLGPNGGTAGRFGLITRRGGVNYYYDWGNQNLYDGRWHMYTVSWDETNVRAYLDGVQIGAPKPHGGNIFIGSAALKAGAGWSDTYGTHTGDLDDIRVYARTLTSSSINRLYTEGLSTHPTLAQN